MRRWDDGRPRSAKAKESSNAYDWIPGMFDGAKHTAAHVRDQACRFIGMKAGCGWGRRGRMNVGWQEGLAYANGQRVCT